MENKHKMFVNNKFRSKINKYQKAKGVYLIA